MTTNLCAILDRVMGDAESSFTSAEDILAELETDTSPLYPGRQRTDLFRRAAFMCAQRGDSDRTRRFWADWLLFSLHAREPDTKEKSGRYLHAMMEIGSSKFPDPDSIPDVMLDYFEERLTQTRNPYLRARYGDFLWDRRRQHDYARVSVEAHLALAPLEAEEDRHYNTGESARRALSLAFTLRDKKLAGAVVETVTRLSEHWVKRAADQAPYFVVQVIEKILDNSRFRTEAVLLRWVSLLEETLQRQNDHYVRRDFLAQLARVLQRIGRPDDARRRRIQIAEDWESEARERESESWLVAASLYQSAMKVYAEQGQSDKVEEMKSKVRDSYRRAEDSEFKAISQRFEVDFTDWDKQVTKWLQLEPADALRHLAACLDLIPSWHTAEKQQAELEKKAPLSQLIPRVTVDDGRPVSQIRTDEEHRLENVRRVYNLYVGVNQCVLSRTFALFREHGALSAASLVDAIKESPVFPDDKTQIIRRGLERYAEGDHISAIHILVPHLEDCLRRLLGTLDTLGAATTMTPAGRMREKLLPEVLEAEQIKAAFGLISDRLWRYFEHVLVAETGLNLRNDVAHGLLRADEANEGTANIIVHLYLLLGLLRTKESAER